MAGLMVALSFASLSAIGTLAGLMDAGTRKSLARMEKLGAVSEAFGDMRRDQTALLAASYAKDPAGMGLASRDFTRALK